MLSFVFLLVVLTSSYGVSAVVVTISDSNGMDDSSCLSAGIPPCRTLSYALQGIIVSNSMSSLVEINVSRGQYNLTNDLFTVGNMDIFSITGQGMNNTIITCNGNGGSIVFNNSRDIVISNVSIIGCGESGVMPRQALAFTNCTNVSLLDVHVSTSLYSAVKIESSKGNIEIINSMFTKNGWSNDTERGGALEISIYGISDTEISIESCMFTENIAITGGAVYIETSGQQNSIFTFVTIVDTTLTGNTAYIKEESSNDMSINGHGGAISLFIDSLTTVTMLGSTISHNMASSGAGVNFYIRDAGGSEGVLGSLLTFQENKFLNNSASVGSAIVLSSMIRDCDSNSCQVLLVNNTFSNNTVGHSIGSHGGLGAVISRYISVSFKGRNTFTGNQKSAIVLLNAVGHFLQESETLFINNSGFNGGALQIYGESSLMVDSNCSLVFVGNTATHKGGAIYHETFDNIQTLPRNCLFHITDRNNSFFTCTFQDNRARDKVNAIYSNAVSSCIIPTRDGSSSKDSIIDSLLYCKRNWEYISSNCNESIESEPIDFIVSNLTNQFGLFSNVRANLPVTIIDIFEANVTDDVTLIINTISTDHISTNPTSGIVSNNTIELIGDEESAGIIQIQTAGAPYKEVGIPFNILHCPPGFLAVESSSGNGSKCQCAVNAYTEGALVCDQNTLTSNLQITNCISQLTPNNSTLVVGSCPFLMGTASTATILLPQDPYEVEEMICGKMNRRGVLCGQCKEGYVPEAYSYLYNCIKCDHIARSWVVYLCAQYLPIIVLFLLITFLRLTIVSPASNAFLFFCQTSSLSNAFVILSFISRYAFGNTLGTVSAQIYNTVYGVWNLDFLRAYLPPICLYDKQDALFVVFIEYFAAFFPFVLVLISYILIVLYNKNFRVIVWAWKLISLCTSKISTNFQSKASLVDAFVTFFVLSYLKVTATAFRFLQFVFVYDINGNILETVFFYDGSVKVYQGIHLFFSILAMLSILTITILPPILLTCYQFKWFHWILEKCHLRSQALVTFVEVLQSGFTDGRNGTKDRRFFAGFYFILRIAIFGPTTVIPQVTIRIVIPFAVYTIGVAALVVFQPYQNSFFNKLDILILLNFLFVTFLILLSFILALSGAPSDTISPLMALSYILAVIPFIYVIIYFARWLLITFKIWRETNHSNSTDGEVFVKDGIYDSVFSVPDRVLRPSFYQSLIVNERRSNKSRETTKKGTNKSSGYDSTEHHPAITDGFVQSEILERNMSATYEMSPYSKSTD